MSVPYMSNRQKECLHAIHDEDKALEKLRSRQISE